MDQEKEQERRQRNPLPLWMGMLERALALAQGWALVLKLVLALALRRERQREREWHVPGQRYGPLWCLWQEVSEEWRCVYVWISLYVTTPLISGTSIDIILDPWSHILIISAHCPSLCSFPGVTGLVRFNWALHDCL